MRKAKKGMFSFVCTEWSRRGWPRGRRTDRQPDKQKTSVSWSCPLDFVRWVVVYSGWLFCTEAGSFWKAKKPSFFATLVPFFSRLFVFNVSVFRDEKDKRRSRWRRELREVTNDWMTRKKEKKRAQGEVTEESIAMNPRVETQLYYTSALFSLSQKKREGKNNKKQWVGQVRHHFLKWQLEPPGGGDLSVGQRVETRVNDATSRKKWADGTRSGCLMKSCLLQISLSFLDWSVY